MMKYKHVPVMLKEVIEFLRPKAGEYFIDCTLGGGGYTIALAKAVSKDGKIVAFDLDEMAISNTKLQIKKQKLKNITLIHENFKNLYKNIENKKSELFSGKKRDGEINCFAGIVFDLGLSSAQLEDRGRGFSFRLDAPLDMGFRGLKRAQEGEEGERTSDISNTEKIINRWKHEDLTKIFRDYGEERYASKIAGAIVKARDGDIIKTTGQLVEIIRGAVPPVYRYKKIHFATRTFQALRIATNRELNNLEVVLPQAVKLLRPSGRVAVVSYHSLEDRIVKRFFKEESRDCVCPSEALICSCEHSPALKIITRKPLVPGPDEIERNPRARSAKLRVAEKL